MFYKDSVYRNLPSLQYMSIRPHSPGIRSKHYHSLFRSSKDPVFNGCFLRCSIHSARRGPGSLGPSRWGASMGWVRRSLAPGPWVITPRESWFTATPRAEPAPVFACWFVTSHHSYMLSDFCSDKTVILSKFGRALLLIPGGSHKSQRCGPGHGYWAGDKQAF